MTVSKAKQPPLSTPDQVVYITAPPAATSKMIAVALSVYRIVQEALTNVVRHAAPARCRVSVVTGPNEVRVEVTDDGPGKRVLPPNRSGGHGLIGMRE